MKLTAIESYLVLLKDVCLLLAIMTILPKLLCSVLQNAICALAQRYVVPALMATISISKEVVKVFARHVLSSFWAQNSFPVKNAPTIATSAISMLSVFLVIRPITLELWIQIIDVFRWWDILTTLLQHASNVPQAA